MPYIHELDVVGEDGGAVGSEAIALAELGAPRLVGRLDRDERDAGRLRDGSEGGGSEGGVFHHPATTSCKEEEREREG